MPKMVKAEELQGHVFEMIGKEWLLVAAEKDGKVNAMTASWGGLGIMWGKEVAFVFLRPQRYTKEFVDAGETFSLSVFGEEKREILRYMGTVSGRDEDKIAKSGLTYTLKDGAPCFDGAKVTMVLKKLYAQPLEEGCFLEKSLMERWYPEKDLHTMYVAEILEISQD